MRASTAVFALATFISRIAGMIRQMVVSAMFGVTNQLAAFTVAFQIPNLIRALVADAALSAAFVPVFTELSENEERDRAWRLAGTLVSLILVVLGPLVVLCMIFAPQIVDLFAGPRFSPADVALAVDLTRILMPIVVLMAASGVIVGILNAHDHFSTPALAPIAWNAVILLFLIAAAATTDKGWDIYLYATGVLVGTLVQLLMPVPWLRGLGGRLSLRAAWSDPRLREILVLMLPVTISLGLINLQQLVDTAFATRVPERFFDGVQSGAGPAILENAFRIYMLPQGIFSVAVATVFFPMLARLAFRGDTDGFRDTFAAGLRQIFVLLIPAAAFMALLAEPIVRLLYQRGQFDGHQTTAVAAALVGYSIGLIFNGASLLLIRAFFSLKKPWLPTIVSLLTLATNALVNSMLYDVYGITGIAATTSIVNLVAFGVLYLLLQREVGLLGTRRTFVVALAGALTSTLAAWLGFEVWHLIDEAAGRAALGQLASVGGAFLVTGAVYLLIMSRLKIFSLRDIRQLRRRALPDDDA